ncbi:unnamed protein product, partial [marine sediment metagenome]
IVQTGVVITLNFLRPRHGKQETITLEIGN